MTRTPSRATNRIYQDMGLDPADTGEWLVDPLWPLARMVALRRDRFTCARCGHPAADVHHRLAKQAGGRMNDPDRHAPERTISMCRACHQWAHSRPIDARMSGFIVRTTDDPLRVPVHTWTGLVLLGHDGRMSCLETKPR